jgi:Tol biopolymer transport system component
MPYIHPEETYIIFSSNRAGGFGNHDLYISFKKSNGTWTTPKNMGDKINGSNEDSFPHLSPDGKFLFFNSSKSGDKGYNPYWVDSKIIDTFK